MNKIIKFYKKASGVPKINSFISNDDYEIDSSLVIDQISKEAANKAFKLFSNNFEIINEQLFLKLLRIKTFNEDIDWVVVYIGITNDENLESKNMSIIDPTAIGISKDTIGRDLVKFINITIFKDELFNSSIDLNPDLIFIKKYIKEILIHEITHASEVINYSDFNSSGRSARRIKKLENLMNIENEDDPLSSFYYTTKEEIAAYLSQITSEIEHELSDYEISNMSINEILNRSLSLPVILKNLELKEDSKTPFGSINRRKLVAKKKILSALYSWIYKKQNKKR